MDRKKKLQEKDQVAKENEPATIDEMLEGSFFSLSGSEAEGYQWDCPICKSANTNSPNISKTPKILSFLCSGCGKIFDVTADSDGMGREALGPMEPLTEEERAKIGTGYPEKPSEFLDQIIAYEMGELDEDEVIRLFQNLIDSGLVWKLQGHYGRTARALIDAGLCHPAHHRAKSKHRLEEGETLCAACGCPIREGEKVYERDGYDFCSKECRKKGPKFLKEASHHHYLRRGTDTPMREVSPQEYSKFVRNLDNVEEVAGESLEGDTIQVKQGPKVVAEVFYPLDRDPVYRISARLASGA
jgi:hypothetical protein